MPLFLSSPASLLVLTDSQASLGMELMNTHLIWEVRGEALRKELYSYDFVTLRFLLT